eukprot:2924409-Amphidinium_carterae.1
MQSQDITWDFAAPLPLSPASRDSIASAFGASPSKRRKGPGNQHKPNFARSDGVKDCTSCASPARLVASFTNM